MATMASLDLPAIGTTIAAVLTAVAAVAGGIYTGRNTRKKDKYEFEQRADEARFKREQAEEEASRARVEQIVQDAAEARKARREMEQMYDRDTRDLRADRQRGWDLARYYYGLMTVLANTLNRLLMNDDFTPEQEVRDAIRAAKIRMEALKIPRTLEEPIPGISMPPTQPQDKPA